MKQDPRQLGRLQVVAGKVRQFLGSDKREKFIRLKRLAFFILGYLISPIAVLIAPVFARRFELVEPVVDRLGHLVIVPDFNLKRLKFEGSKKRLVLLAPVVANSYLLDLWCRHMTVVRNPLACAVLLEHFFYAFPSRKKYRIGRSSKVDKTYCNLNRKYGHILKGALDQGEIERGRTILEKLGLPRSAWFVTFHAREPTYLANLSHLSKETREGIGVLHAYRDFDIDDYLPAMHWVVENGGYAVRLGETGSKPLPVSPRIIDYANSRQKSAFLDVFLCSQCRFFMGCNSGPVDLAAESGVPATSVNFLPWPGAHRSANMIMTSKFVWSKSKHRYLSFPELFATEMGAYFDTRQYQAAGLEVHNNTPNDLLKVTMETFESAAGTVRYSDEDERVQERFKNMIPKDWPSKELNARMGRDFLSDYRWILGDGAPPSTPISGAEVQVR